MFARKVTHLNVIYSRLESVHWLPKPRLLLKTTVFWDVGWRFTTLLRWRQYASLKYQYISTWLQGALINEVVSTSETSVNFYQTTRRNSLEGHRIHNCCRENLNHGRLTFLFLSLFKLIQGQYSYLKISHNCFHFIMHKHRLVICYVK
jgi:hypothetical protein